MMINLRKLIPEPRSIARSVRVIRAERVRLVNHPEVRSIDAVVRAQRGAVGGSAVRWLATLPAPARRPEMGFYFGANPGVIALDAVRIV